MVDQYLFNDIRYSIYKFCKYFEHTSTYLVTRVLFHWKVMDLSRSNTPKTYSVDESINVIIILATDIHKANLLTYHNQMMKQAMSIIKITNEDKFIIAVPM